MTNEKIPELPAELRRAARISTSGYWAGVLLAAADEIEAARRANEPEEEPMKELDQFVLDLLEELDKLESEVSGFQQMEIVVRGIQRAIEVAQAKMETRTTENRGGES